MTIISAAAPPANSTSVPSTVSALPEVVHADLLPADVDLVPQHVPASQNPAVIYLASLGVRSRRTMTYALDTVGQVLTGGACGHDTLPWNQLDQRHTHALRAILADRYTPRTVNLMLSALRGTLKAAWRLQQIDTETYLRAIDFKPVKQHTLAQAAGRALTPGEISAVLAACAADPTPAGVRDAALFALGVRCGLRRGEFPRLSLGSYDTANHNLLVLGKGNKPRTVPVGPGVRAVLADWLHLHPGATDALFVRIRKGGHLTDQGLGEQAVYEAIEKRRLEAGVQKFTPHDLRRTFAGDLLDAGVDISIVQQLMGHADASTTAGYDRRPERAKVDAVNRLHLAWSRRYV